MFNRKTTVMYNDKEINLEVCEYDERDRQEVVDVYTFWKAYRSRSRSWNNKARNNFPEIISEGVFCMATGAVKIIKAPSGFSKAHDCYDLTTNERIELKATSIKDDLTSFSPNFNFDRFYFIDFYKDGTFNGKFDIYEIPKSVISNSKVNRNDTVIDQQAEHRRPRFSVLNQIIRPYNIKPIILGNIYGGRGNNQRVAFKKRHEASVNKEKFLSFVA